MNNKYINSYEKFLKVELNYSNNTVESYIRDIKQFLDLYNIDIKKIEEKDLQSYLNFLNENYKPTTYSRKVSSLKTFYKYLDDEFKINNIFHNIKNPKQEKKIPKYFPKEKLYELLDSIEITNKFDIRDKAMLELLYASGMRISELLNLTIFDIKKEEKFVKVLGKGNKERMIPINKASLEALKEYEKIRVDFLDYSSNILFLNKKGNRLSRQGFDKILKQRAKKVGISDISAHKLRHSIATHLLNDGADLRMIQQFLGHKNIVTTEIYTHVNKSQLQSEYEKYFDDKIFD